MDGQEMVIEASGAALACLKNQNKKDQKDNIYWEGEALSLNQTPCTSAVAKIPV